MKSWILILGGLAASWHFTDLSSPETFSGLVAPVLIGFFLIALLVKIVFMGSTSGRSNGDSGSYFGGFDGDGGGDCGGGGCD